MPKIVELLCMHHTHLDIGYTHVQPALLKLHMDYIDEVLDLCTQTEDWPDESRFRWTCETTLPVRQWLTVARQENQTRFRHFLDNGQICIAAQLFHATPLADSEQLIHMLQPIRQLREQFGIAISTSINHDINGQPWPLSQILLDAGVKLHIMGINTHFGGYPLKRPYLFRWQTPDQQDILAFNGEIYVKFNWLFQPYRNDLNFIEQQMEQYIAALEASAYPYPFAFMTATNPPLCDNNGPDYELPNLIRQWNERGYPVKIKLATSDMLLECIEKIPRSDIPVHAGDWTDYWNFGSASSAKMTRLHRKARRKKQTADLLESILGCPSPQYSQASTDAQANLDLYTEHTWGHMHNIDHPDRFDVEEGWHHKAHFVYEASGLTSYLLGSQMESLAGNPRQSGKPEGVLLINPTSAPLSYRLCVNREYYRAGRHLAASRIEAYTVSNDKQDSSDEYSFYGTFDIPPFSWKTLKLDSLKKERSLQEFPLTSCHLENAYFRLEFEPTTGKISALWDKIHAWQIADTMSTFSFFQYIQETIDPTANPVSRKTFYDAQVNGWNQDWKALRQGPHRLLSCLASQNGPDAVLVLRWHAPGVKMLEQKITLYGSRQAIGLDLWFDKEDIRTPEGIYIAFPLNLEPWNCQFDTAGMFVALDTEQLPGACRDWLTVDKTVSVYDGQHGITLACPDAPMVQVGGFRFGRKSTAIPRESNPLLLAWPMNNYWETNFPAKQPGIHRLYYELSTFSTFDPVTAFRAGIAAGQDVEIAPIISCSIEQEGRLLNFKGDGIVPLYIKPALDGCGIILHIRNLCREPKTASCDFTNRSIRHAFIVDTLQHNLEELPHDGQTLHVHLGPGVLRQFRLIF